VSDSIDTAHRYGQATGDTIEEPTYITPGSDEGGGNDDDEDAAHSTPHAPTHGMRFESFKYAKEHYRAYAERKGFGIRIDWGHFANDAEYDRVNIVCTCAGKPHKKKEAEISQNPKSVVPTRKYNTHPRTGCKARMYLKRKDAWYHVEDFDDEHNHPLILKPSLTRFSHRGIPPEEQVFLRMLHACNIPTSRQMQLMAQFYGGLSEVPYIAKDVSNLRAKFRNEHNHHDMQDTLEYFAKIHNDDPDFFVKISLDEECRVQSIFWVDGAARRAYKSFSDCISFDTTYLTNRYKMPCAPFIGINNHGLSIQLGCGFVRNELKNSFVWLFKMFLEAMGGVQPKSIITDQDTAMKEAIKVVFTDAIHRNCRWHVMQNATERIGPFMGKNPELLAAFNACVNNSLTLEEFEKNWMDMINLYGVKDNIDLFSIWKERKCWVPAYFMHAFFPFLQTTARSEGFNAVLKRYINPKNSIFDFLKQYMAIQDKINNAEEKAEAETALTDPPFWSRNPMERKMAKLYTRNIFYKF